MGAAHHHGGAPTEGIPAQSAAAAAKPAHTSKPAALHPHLARCSGAAQLAHTLAATARIYMLVVKRAYACGQTRSNMHPPCPAASGDSAVLEWIDGSITVYHSRNYTV